MSDTDTTTGLGDLGSSTESLSGTLTRLDGLSKTFGQSLTIAFKGAAVQGKSLDVVLRSIGDRLSSKALDAALSPLTSAIAGGTSSLMKGLLGAFGLANGGVLQSGRVTPFADGGIVSTPTYFPMRGATGLMGEAGAEAIMPLSRGPDGRLGVATRGEAGSAPRITLNVTTPDAESFRRSEAQLTSVLARAVGRGRRGL